VCEGLRHGAVWHLKGHQATRQLIKSLQGIVEGGRGRGGWREGFVGLDLQAPRAITTRWTTAQNRTGMLPSWPSGVSQLKQAGMVHEHCLIYPPTPPHLPPALSTPPRPPDPHTHPHTRTQQPATASALSPPPPWPARHHHLQGKVRTAAIISPPPTHTHFPKRHHHLQGEVATAPELHQPCQVPQRQHRPPAAATAAAWAPAHSQLQLVQLRGQVCQLVGVVWEVAQQEAGVCEGGEGGGCWQQQVGAGTQHGQGLKTCRATGRRV